MTGPMDDLLRDAVHGLADGATAGHRLAAGAVVRGRRMRRRRKIGWVVAGAVLVAGVGAPFVVFDGVGAPPPRVAASQAAVPPSASPSSAATPARVGADWAVAPIVLPGDWVVTGAARSYTDDYRPALDDDLAAGNVVLDRKQGRYRTISGRFQEIWPSPDGAHVAVLDQDQHMSEIGVLTVATGKVRWLAASWALDPQWSPDGSRLLLTGSRGFTVLDASSGTKKRYEVDQDAYLCTDFCLYTWLPGGEEVAIALTDPSAPRSEAAPHERRGVQAFSATTGKPTRLLPVKGNPAGTTSWSPDGRYVLLSMGFGAGSQVVEIATGKVVATLPNHGGHVAGDDRILTVVDGVAVLYAFDGTEVARLQLPREFRGRSVAVAPATPAR